MKKLRAGLAHFQDVVFPRHRALFERLAKNQTPRAVFITCSDSRILPNLIVQAEPGELFLIRNVGNIVPPAGTAYGGTTAALEYAIVALGIRKVILCGHSNCGAMRGVLHPETLDALPAVRQWVSYADPARRAAEAEKPGAKDDELLDAVVGHNVICQLANLRTFPFVRPLAEKGEIELHGWVYDIATGRVRGLGADGKTFLPVGADAERLPGERRLLSAMEGGEELWEEP